jgi:hypothetical protein
MADKIPLKLTTGPNEIQEFAAGGTPDTVPKVNLPTTVVYTGDTQTLSQKTLDATNKISSKLLDVTGSAPVLSVTKSGLPTSGNYSCPKLIVGVTAQGAIIGVDSSTTNSDLNLQATGSGKVNVGALGPVVGETGSQTLTNKTLTQPVIGDFTNAGHSHSSAAQGGAIDAAAIGSGSFSQDRIADIGNRSGSYAFGRGNSVLIDGTTAAGSGGTSRWAERSRVAQVQAANYTVSTNGSTATYANCTSLSITCSATSGFSFNTTPDCIVDNTGGGLGLSSALRKGKTIRLTLNGSLTASTTRTANLQFRYNAGVMSVSLQAASIPAGTFPWAAVAYAVFHGTQDGVGANIHIWIESFKVFQAGATIDGIGVVGSSFTPTTISNGSVVSFDARMQFTVGAVGDSLACYNAVWEVLN